MIIWGLAGDSCSMCDLLRAFTRACQRLAVGLSWHHPHVSTTRCRLVRPAGCGLSESRAREGRRSLEVLRRFFRPRTQLLRQIHLLTLSVRVVQRIVLGTIPVAMMSSTTRTCCPSLIASFWIWKKSSPYSFLKPAVSVGPGSFPSFRTGTKAAPSRRAKVGPNRRPLASNPTITSGLWPWA